MEKAARALPASRCTQATGGGGGSGPPAQSHKGAQHSSADFHSYCIQLDSTKSLPEIPRKNAVYFQMCVISGYKILLCRYDRTGNKRQVQNGLSPALKRSELLCRTQAVKNLLN